MKLIEKQACLKVFKFSNRKKKKKKMLLKAKVCHATREPQSLEAENKVNEAAASVDVLKQDFSTNRMSFFFFGRSQKTFSLFGEEYRVSSHPRGRRSKEGGGAVGGWVAREWGGTVFSGTCVGYLFREKE